MLTAVQPGCALCRLQTASDSRAEDIEREQLRARHDACMHHLRESKLELEVASLACGSGSHLSFLSKSSRGQSRHISVPVGAPETPKKTAELGYISRYLPTLFEVPAPQRTDQRAPHKYHQFRRI